MSIRYSLAIAATDSFDLADLAQKLASAVKDSIADGIVPCSDPAIRLICQHIAFAGNGDINFQKYYRDVFAYCAAKAAVEVENSPIKEVPNVPPYQAS